MAKIRRLLLVAAVGAVAAAWAAPRAFGCGNSGGYSYAGLGDPTNAFGVSAQVTELGDYPVRHGHIAAWVGVGGPDEGPNGSDEWLQTGLSRFPNVSSSDVYYEVALPNVAPAYHKVLGDFRAGRSVRLAVTELRGRPNWWRVYMNGKAVSVPILLPHSHDRWAPMATAESWDGDTGGACNAFLYRFRHVRFARGPGGPWGTSPRGYTISGATTKVRRAHRNNDFLAAEGWRAKRRLASLRP